MPEIAEMSVGGGSAEAEARRIAALRIGGGTSFDKGRSDHQLIRQNKSLTRGRPFCSRLHSPKLCIAEKPILADL